LINILVSSLVVAVIALCDSGVIPALPNLGGEKSSFQTSLPDQPGPGQQEKPFPNHG
jgi:hypothetical protein